MCIKFSATQRSHYIWNQKRHKHEVAVYGKLTVAKISKHSLTILINRPTCGQPLTSGLNGSHRIQTIAFPKTGSVWLSTVAVRPNTKQDLKNQFTKYRMNWLQAWDLIQVYEWEGNSCSSSIYVSDHFKHLKLKTWPWAATTFITPD